MLIRHSGDYRWENVQLLAYKEEGNHFKNITRQILLDGQPELPCQVRYFEIAAGGHSTLEKHQHVHYVVVARGIGDALVGDDIYQVHENDILMIPSLTWHQFRATTDQPLGFICLVNMERDKALLPSQQDLEVLNKNPRIAEFIRC